MNSVWLDSGKRNTPKSPGAVMPVLYTKKAVRMHHHRSVLVLSSDALECTT